MSSHAPASSTTTEQDPRYRVTRWEFEPGTATGMHRHEFDYVVIPITGGPFSVLGEDGSETRMEQVPGQTYARSAGVVHDVRYAGDDRAVFVEVEFLTDDAT